MRKALENIINLPHHRSTTRPSLTMEQRAAQFAPFAALTGFDDEIEETGRLTDIRPELSEDDMAELDRRLRIIDENPGDEFEIVYFVPDGKKEGGRLAVYTGKCKKIDKYRRVIVGEEKNEIPVDDVVCIKGRTAEIFRCET